MPKGRKIKCELWMCRQHCRSTAWENTVRPKNTTLLIVFRATINQDVDQIDDSACVSIQRHEEIFNWGLVSCQQRFTRGVFLGVQRGGWTALHQKANGQPNVDHDQSNGPLGARQTGGDQQAGGYRHRTVGASAIPSARSLKVVCHAGEERKLRSRPVCPGVSVPRARRDGTSDGPSAAGPHAAIWRQGELWAVYGTFLYNHTPYAWVFVCVYTYVWVCVYVCVKSCASLRAFGCRQSYKGPVLVEHFLSLISCYNKFLCVSLKVRSDCRHKSNF